MSNDIKRTWQRDGGTLTDGLAVNMLNSCGNRSRRIDDKNFSKLAAELELCDRSIDRSGCEERKVFNTVVVMDPSGEVQFIIAKKIPGHSPSADGQAMAISAIP